VPISPFENQNNFYLSFNNNK